MKFGRRRNYSIGAFSVIVKTDGSFAALVPWHPPARVPPVSTPQVHDWSWILGDDDARASATWPQQPRHAHYFWRVKSDVGLSMGRGAGAGGGAAELLMFSKPWDQQTCNRSLTMPLLLLLALRTLYYSTMALFSIWLVRKCEVRMNSTYILLTFQTRMNSF